MTIPTEGPNNVVSVPKAKSRGKAWRSVGSPTSDKAVWGHSPDVPVWRDVIPDETEVAPGRNWPSNDICKTRRLGGQGIVRT